MKPSTTRRIPRRGALLRFRSLPALLCLAGMVAQAPAAAQRIQLQTGTNLFGQHVVEPVETTGTVQQTVPVPTAGDLIINALFPSRPGGLPGPAEADRHYTIEFDSGFWAALEGWRPDTQVPGRNVRMVIRDPGAALRPAAGTTFRLRRARTVSELFGRLGSCVLKTGSQQTADLVMIRSHDRWLTLWHSNRFGPLGDLAQVSESWRIAGRNGDHPDLPIFFVQGIMLIRRGPPLQITLTGDIKPGPTLINLDDPLVRWVTDRGEIWALFSSVHGPVELPDVPAKTLGNSGLLQSGPGFQAVTPAPNFQTADNVLLYNAGGGGYQRYFNPVNFFLSVPELVPSNEVPLTSALVIHRRNPAAYFVRLNP